MIVGGSAAPQSMIEGFEQRHGLHVVARVGHDRDGPARHGVRLSSRELALADEEQFAYRAKQGLPAPFVEIRARDDDGLVPWDGETMGELEVRGAVGRGRATTRTTRRRTAGPTTAGS